MLARGGEINPAQEDFSSRRIKLRHFGAQPSDDLAVMQEEISAQCCR